MSYCLMFPDNQQPVQLSCLHTTGSILVLFLRWSACYHLNSSNYTLVKYWDWIWCTLSTNKILIIINFNCRVHTPDDWTLQVCHNAIICKSIAHLFACALFNGTPKLFRQRVSIMAFTIDCTPKLMYRFLTKKWKTSIWHSYSYSPHLVIISYFSFCHLILWIKC